MISKFVNKQYNNKFWLTKLLFAMKNKILYHFDKILKSDSARVVGRPKIQGNNAQKMKRDLASPSSSSDMAATIQHRFEILAPPRWSFSGFPFLDPIHLSISAMIWCGVGPGRGTFFCVVPLHHCTGSFVAILRIIILIFSKHKSQLLLPLSATRPFEYCFFSPPTCPKRLPLLPPDEKYFHFRKIIFLHNELGTKVDRQKVESQNRWKEKRQSIYSFEKKKHYFKKIDVLFLRRFVLSMFSHFVTQTFPNIQYTSIRQCLLVIIHLELCYNIAILIRLIQQ